MRAQCCHEGVTQVITYHTQGQHNWCYLATCALLYTAHAHGFLIIATKLEAANNGEPNKNGASLPEWV